MAAQPLSTEQKKENEQALKDYISPEKYEGLRNMWANEPSRFNRLIDRFRGLFRGGRRTRKSRTRKSRTRKTRTRKRTRKTRKTRTRKTRTRKTRTRRSRK